MPLGARTSEVAGREISFAPVAFDDLPGWQADDHLDAFRAFVRSAAPIAKVPVSSSGKTRLANERLVAIAADAARRAKSIATREAAKAFFQANFVPHRIVHDRQPGLLTGYYEPLLAGAREPGDRYRFPVYRRPSDLVNLVGEQERGALADGLTHARRTANGTEPYATRADIDNGALDGQGLEFVWLADAVDNFFMHIQGSGRIRFPDGATARVTYDGKNGHPYTSIGRYLIDNGHFTADEMTLDALKVWLSADAARGRSVMQENRSFVFFREIAREEDGPLGALEIPLSPGRSLAVDTAFHALGAPVYVSAPELRPWSPGEGFARLMIAQDVGSAIRGPERGDIYFGSGDEAGRLAGSTKHAGVFFALLPSADHVP
jgi:membrane-bound lytic murein transglycosylase A